MKKYLFFLIIISVIPNHLIAQVISDENEKHPCGRMYHSLVYDHDSGYIVLFPGAIHHGWSKDLFTNDLWMFNLNTYNWIYKGMCFNDTTDNRPGITTITYDIESKKYITFDNSGRTWAFDLTSTKWENMNPENSPEPRCGQGMVYDEESDRIVMFGGFGCTGVHDPVYSDTWAYDYNTNTWTRMNPENAPSERMYFAITYDKSADKVVLWGGRKLEPIDDSKIWTYDFNKDEWEPHITQNGPEKPLAYPSMVYMDKSEEIFLYGGSKLISAFVGETSDESWIYSMKKEKWNKIYTDSRPPKLANFGLAYDKIHDRIILFGGEIDSLYSNNVSSETWIYDLIIKNWFNND